MILARKVGVHCQKELVCNAKSAYPCDVYKGCSRHFGSSPVAGAVGAVKELVRVVVADDLLAGGIETETATHAAGDVCQVW